ncbi:recombination protein MgsA [Nitrosomonas sp. PY1]|uniref:replication-associated recombination protein A n=1 Tax=Nitrosomonas sp. PY1 TaxID=1803906 RepID=UPI001FC8C8BE|nr:replication-associated recombination protein A [Nitrosomonas sp. PY1]GKS69261.1 recombination protein MgsA [Nitrosomonas sp. PY1]
MSSVNDNVLFSANLPQAPLAEQLRPKHINDVIGQNHLLGIGKPLRIVFESGKLHSMILWGPPGTGKTTLARIMSNSFDSEFIALSAVMSGVKEIRHAMDRAELVLQQKGRHTILFVDEVHRFNKSQQDAFLPYIEQGLITFIGATTENPSFEINHALLSRAQVYILTTLSELELSQLIERANKLVFPHLQFTHDARQLLIEFSDGDARRLFNLLEQIDHAIEPKEAFEVGKDYIVNTLSRNTRQFDKGGDTFYEQISALHKSVRGSAPDASLYWLCRMLDGGADALYIARRLVRMATEDIGLSDPRALRLTLDAYETFERLGSPEGELALAQAVVYLACAPKSNAVYKAYNKARQFIAQDKSRPVPVHLRNAATQFMKQIGYGDHYRYAHDCPDAYAAGENYFPEGMPAVNFYQPTGYGLEQKIQEKLAYLRSLDEQASRKI